MKTVFLKLTGPAKGILSLAGPIPRIRVEGMGG